MKKTVCLLSMAMLVLTGCQDSNKPEESTDQNPAFLVGCFRKEIVSETFRVPQLSTIEEAANLRQHISLIPGYMNSSTDLQNRTLTINYKSSMVRRMNFEEAIAKAGYTVNNRPANLQKNNLTREQ